MFQLVTNDANMAMLEKHTLLCNLNLLQMAPNVKTTRHTFLKHFHLTSSKENFLEALQQQLA